MDFVFKKQSVPDSGNSCFGKSSGADYCTRFSGKNREAQYKQILRYIHKHYDQKIYLEDLAASLNMNPQYFCRFFKKQFQMTPVAYINYYRTLQAADLLKHTSLSILEIGLRAGFENPSYFAKIFRKYFDCSPEEYRMHPQDSDNVNGSTF